MDKLTSIVEELGPNGRDPGEYSMNYYILFRRGNPNQFLVKDSEVMWIAVSRFGVSFLERGRWVFADPEIKSDWWDLLSDGEEIGLVHSNLSLVGEIDPDTNFDSLER